MKAVECCCITSVCLIYYQRSAADSKKLLPDMKMLNVVSDRPTYVPTIPTIFWPALSVMPEISTDFAPHNIIDFHIYSFILSILEAILGINVAKTFRVMVLQKLALTVDVASQGMQILTNFIWSG